MFAVGCYGHPQFRTAFFLSFFMVIEINRLHACKFAPLITFQGYTLPALLPKRLEIQSFVMCMADTSPAVSLSSDFFLKNVFLCHSETLIF